MVSDERLPITTASVDELRAAMRKTACLSLCSRADPARRNVPIVQATNPLGSLILGSGMMPLAGAVGGLAGVAVVAPIVNAMPLGLIGMEVFENVHRLDIVGTMPDARRGVRASNAVGMPVGTVTTKWMLAPDDFEPGPGRVPPPTPLDQARSQKFVMLDWRQEFHDGRGSGLCGSGSGRTFPAVVDGQSQLRVAGVIDAVAGSGNLAGLSGTIVVNGHVTPPYGLSLSLLARITDPHLRTRTTTAIPGVEREPTPPSEPHPGVTFLVLLGETDEDGRVEQLRLVQAAFDVTSSAGVRADLMDGPVVGTHEADLDFDTAHDTPTAVRSRHGLFTFTDRFGRVVGTLAADIVEGRGSRCTVAGLPVYRIGGFGPLLKGTGAFDGAVGMMTASAVVSVSPRMQSTLYVLRISDPGGRYRASVAEASPRPDARHAAGAAGSDDLDAEDRKIVAQVDQTRRDTAEVQRWWHARAAGGDYAERFELVREFNQDEHTVGFFDTASVGGRRLRVMGVEQELFYDLPKKSSPEEVRDQLREFVLGYFMRVSHTQRPEPVSPLSQGALPLFLRPLSWLPDMSDTRVGFGYEQLLYRRSDTGQVGKFQPDEQGAIVDLRTLGTVYDWLAMRVNIFDFKIGMSPFGPDILKMELPMKEVTYLLMTPEMVVNRDNPSPDVLGEYGFGYGLLPYAPEPDIFAFGPGHFDAGYQSFLFRVLRTGEIRADAVFVVNRPDKMLKVDVDPVDWGFKAADLVTGNLASKALAPLKALAERLPLRLSGIDPVSLYISAANVMSAGLAASQLGVSKTQLEKHMLMRHVIQHRQMLIGSQLVWRMVHDWTDHGSLPEFCHRGLTG